MRKKILWATGFALVGLVHPALAADIYATADRGTSLIRINAATGATTPIGPLGYVNTYAGAFTSDGRFWTLIDVGTALGQVNLSTGAATQVGLTGLSGSTVALAGNATGELYAMSYSGVVYRANLATGNLAPLFTTLMPNAMDLAFDAAGMMWAVGGSAVWRIDIANSTAQQVSALSIDAMGLAIDAGGNFFVTNYSQTPQLYNLNPLTGVTTPIGPIGAEYTHGGDFAPVPEPASLAALGIASLALLRKRRS